MDGRDSAGDGVEQPQSTPAHAKPAATAPPPPDLGGKAASASPEGANSSSDNSQDNADQVDYALQAAGNYPDLHRRVSWHEAIKGSGGDDFITETVGPEDDDDQEEEFLDGDDDLDEFHEMPSCRGVVEWLFCLLFDCLILLFEVGMSLWLASSLYEQELVGCYRAIIIILVLPCLFNPLVWVSMHSSYRYISCNPLVILGVSALGFPSPLFIYIWHLYLSMFSSRKDSMQSKQLANTFRIVQAFVCSVPLILINIVTLINALKVETPESEMHADLHKLANHMGSVKMHSLAFVVSFFNLTRAAALFNERQTFTLLFVLVGFPFILLTLISRLVMLGVVSAFLKAEWTAIILLGLTFINILLYLACRKRRIYYAPAAKKSSQQSGKLKSKGLTKYSKSNTSEDFEMDDVSSDACGACCGGTAGGGGSQALPGQPGRQAMAAGGPSPIGVFADDVSDDCVNCCSSRNRSYTYAMDKASKGGLGGKTGRDGAPLFDASPVDETVRGSMLKTVSLSILSIVVPSSYSNDGRCHHPRLKGGLFLMLNYLTNMIVLGVSLSYTIIHYVPTDLKGVVLPNPNVNIELPAQSMKVGIFGFNIKMLMPNSVMNPAKMSPGANLNISSSEDQMYYLAILVPIMLGFIVLPFVTMRAAMMEMDCFITSKKLLDVIDVESYVYRKNRMQRRGGGGSRRGSSSARSTASTGSGAGAGGGAGSGSGKLHIGRVSLLDTIAKNTDSREIKCRMYTTICCGMCGMGIMVMVFMLLGAVVFGAFYTIAS